MKTFLALVSKQEMLDPDLLALVPSLAAQALSFRHMPYRTAAWQSRRSRLAIFAWDNDGETAPDAPLIHADGERAITFAGYVSHPALTSPWEDVTGLARACTMSDKSVSDLGGMFALVQASEDDEEMLVWKTAGHATPVYWIETPDFIAICTRALLLSFLLTQAPRPVYEPATFVPFLTRGRFANDQTPFRGVRKLLSNSCISSSHHGVTVRAIDDFDRTCGSVQPSSADYDVLCGLLLASVRTLPKTRVVCSLTGGKDSRIVAATLHHAGIDFTTQTRGLPESPDVLVAQKVAAALGVPHRISPVSRTMTDNLSAVSVDPLDRARQILFGSDGMLSAYENLTPARRFTTGHISAGGQGGEVPLRDSFGTGPLSWEVATEFLLSYYLLAPELFVPDAFVRHRAFLNEQLVAERALGTPPTVALDLFSLRFDLGTAGIGTSVSENGRYGLYPLMDNQVTKAGLQAHPHVKLSDKLLYNVLARLAPSLTDVPFADKRWNFERKGPRPGDEQGWVQRTPVTAPPDSRGIFDWRHNWSRELWSTFHEQIFGDTRAAALFEVLDRQAFQRWFDGQRGTVNSGWAALAWSAYSASVLFSNDWLDADGMGSAEVLIPIPIEA